MSLIGKPIVEFSADAYYNGEFIKVSNDDLQENGRFCFYPADFSFVCPTELGDLQEQYAELQNLVLKCILFQQIRISFIKLGTMILMLSEQSLTL